MKNKKQKKINIPRPDRILSYFKHEKGVLGIVTVTGIIYNAGLIAGPWFEGQLALCLFNIINGEKTFYDMVTLALIYVAVIAFIQFMRYFKRYFVRVFSNNVNRTMKHVLYKNILSKSTTELKNEDIGSTMTKAVSDVDACSEGMRKFTTEVFDTWFALLVYLVTLCIYDIRIALISCAFTPAAYVWAHFFEKTVNTTSKAARESAGRLNAATLDRVSGAVTYRIYGCEAGRDAAYEEQLADYEKRSVKANLMLSVMQPLYGIISLTGVFFIIWLGGRNVLGVGWSQWDIAAFTTFLSCFLKLSVKSSKSAKLFNSVQKAKVSWKRIKPLMKSTPGFSEVEPAHSAVLTVSGLSFSYPGGSDIFTDISFCAKPGEIIGVTGIVASGKSTLGKVFLCEYPYSGDILFGDKDISGYTPAERTGIFTYMGHSPELLDDTIANNILLGKEGDAEKYLRLVCLDSEVAAMPDGINTMIGDGGILLSGGQQARLALARTLCHKRPVIILDDPFAAVDRTTEKHIFENLRKEAADCVVILISHRLFMFPEADRVLFLDNGRLICATHEKMLGKCDGYSLLYRTQTEGGTENEK